ncbi:MAG: acyl transferase [Bacteroidia bacterium]
MLNKVPDIRDVWSVTDHNFNDIALEIFQFQVKNNKVYAEYVKLIDQQPHQIEHYSQIPFLPISFFKSHKVVSTSFIEESVFESSSTTGIDTSKNYVPSLATYHQNCLKIINEKLGEISQYEILGLLPNYLERGNSSLVSMVDFLMKHNQQLDGFFLHEHEMLYSRLTADLSGQKKLLFGVSFALLDFADEYTTNEPITIIETGGMKGRKKEMTKSEVYAQLQEGFPNATIISEYGMTELMSQAYSDQHAVYSSPPWMKILPRADNDPLSHSANGQTSALNIIDLANIHSCSFIATDDLGKIHSNETFEVIGRLDHADIRGCSLMI